MLSRSNSVQARSTRVEPGLIAKKASEKQVGATRREPFKDVTNVRSTASGRVRVISKPLQKSSSTAAVTVKGVKRSATAALGEEMPLEVGRQSTLAVASRQESMETRARKKRRSEASESMSIVDDPMQIDEEESIVSVPERRDIPHEDIDVYDWDDPQAVTEYVDDIYNYMREVELKYMASPKYMAIQVDVNEKMRGILVDWLVEVHRMFKLLPETLFLSVNIIDRYLESKQVARDKLQLVGVTAMLIASKYEEIYAPECNDFVYISDGAYTKEQILNMEQLILNTLGFNLNAPSPLHFLRRYSKASGSDYNVHTLCKYLIELTILDIKLLKYPASSLAAGAVYIARHMTRMFPTWTTTLEYYTHLGEAEVRLVAQDMNNLLKKAAKSNLKAIKKKYSQPKYGQVATLPVVDI